MCLHTFYDHTDSVQDVAFHPNGLCIASASSDRSIKMWDTRTGQLLQVCRVFFDIFVLPGDFYTASRQHYGAHSGTANSLSFHPSGNYLVSGGEDMVVKLWDLREGHLYYTLHGHEGAVRSVNFSPSGDFFASGGTDMQIMVRMQSCECSKC